MFAVITKIVVLHLLFSFGYDSKLGLKVRPLSPILLFFFTILSGAIKQL